jgi:hypothetical protein
MNFLSCLKKSFILIELNPSYFLWLCEWLLYNVFCASPSGRGLIWKLSVQRWKGGCSWPSGRSVKPSGQPRVFRSQRFTQISDWDEIGVVGKLGKIYVNWVSGWPLIESRRTPSGWKDFLFRTALRKIPELLSEQEKLGPFGRSWLPFGYACLRLHFLVNFWFPKPINKRLEACFQHRIRWWILHSLERVFREILKIC